MKQRIQNGFTLIEVLLAISLMVVIMTITTTIIFQVNKTKAITDAELRRRSEIRLVRDLIARDLSNIVYLNELASNGYDSGLIGIAVLDTAVPINQMYFHVNQSSLNSSLIDTSTDPKLQTVSYYLRKNLSEAGLYNLYRRERFFVEKKFEIVSQIFEPETLPTTAALTSTLISDRIVSMHVEYIGSDTTTVEADWNSAAKPSGQKIPKAVKIEIELKAADGSTNSLAFQENLRIPIASATYQE